MKLNSTKFTLIMLLIICSGTSAIAQTELLLGRRGNSTTVQSDFLFRGDTLGGGVNVTSMDTLVTDFVLPDTTLAPVIGLFGMSLNPISNQMYVVYGISANADERRLGILNTVTATITDIANVGRITDITFMDNILFGTTGNSHPDQFSLVTINLTTGAYTFVKDHLTQDNSNALVFDYFSQRFIKSTQFTPRFDEIDPLSFVETNLLTGSHPGWTTGLAMVDSTTMIHVGNTSINTMDLTTFTWTVNSTFGTNEWWHSVAFTEYPLSLWVDGKRKGCSNDTSILTIVSAPVGAVVQWFENGLLIPGAIGLTYETNISAIYHAAVNGIETNIVETEIGIGINMVAFDSILCPGETLTLDGTADIGSTPVTWDMGITNGVSFTPPSGTTIYTGTIGVTDCDIIATITVNSLPNVTASVTDTVICFGDSLLLYGGGASTYAWDVVGVLDSVYYVAPVGNTTYTVTGTDTNGCVNTATVDALVNANPTVIALVNDSSVCDGDSILLAGSGALTYTWDMGVTDSVSFTPSIGSATYTVIGVDTNGCMNTATIDATVYSSPIITATVDTNIICEGNSVIFTGGGGNSYSWDLGVVDGISFVPTLLGTTTYTVTGTDTNGCTNTDTINVEVNASPTLTALVSDTVICFGDSLLLYGGGASTYAWDVAGVLDSVYYVAPVGNTTYTVTGTDANGCVNTATVDALVNANPTVIALVNDSSVCDGDSIVLTGSGALTYTWDLGVADNMAFAPSIGSTTYTVIGVDTNGCMNTATIDATVYSSPIITATVDTNIICEGNSVIFTGGGGNSYSWDLGVVDGISFVPTLLGTTTYTVAGTDTNGCTNTDTINVEVTINQVVLTGMVTMIETLGADGEIEITVTGGTPSYTYDWDNDGTGDFDDNEDLSGLVAATYVVVVKDSEGCEQTDSFILDTQVGIEELDQNTISVYPNPTLNDITINIEGQFTYQIYNITGAILINDKGFDISTVSLEGLAKGLYVLKINANGKIKTIEVIKK